MPTEQPSTPPNPGPNEDLKSSAFEILSNKPLYFGSIRQFYGLITFFIGITATAVGFYFSFKYQLDETQKTIEVLKTESMNSAKKFHDDWSELRAKIEKQEIEISALQAGKKDK